MLCEFDPDEAYRWFAELFIDSTLGDGYQHLWYESLSMEGYGYKALHREQPYHENEQL